uniref:Uncharacterized protein n=1 Tax=Myotis myotis TaxID=51298 RepID=A0A7J7VYR8_MYOMY|nr:hypothetical protein mMyoMyo1_012206 [Myotis myotis]
MGLCVGCFHMVVLHGNVRGRDQMASQVISRLISRFILYNRCTLTKVKHLGNKYVFLPLNQHTLELKENSNCPLFGGECLTLITWDCMGDSDSAEDGPSCWAAKSMRTASKLSDLRRKQCPAGERDFLGKNIVYRGNLPFEGDF